MPRLSLGIILKTLFIAAIRPRTRPFRPSVFTPHSAKKQQNEPLHSYGKKGRPLSTADPAVTPPPSTGSKTGRERSRLIRKINTYSVPYGDAEMLDRFNDSSRGTANEAKETASFLVPLAATAHRSRGSKVHCDPAQPAANYTSRVINVFCASPLPAVACYRTCHAARFRGYPSILKKRNDEKQIRLPPLKER